jgi:hypothetical protein
MKLIKLKKLKVLKIENLASFNSLYFILLPKNNGE